MSLVVTTPSPATAATAATATTDTTVTTGTTGTTGTTTTTIPATGGDSRTVVRIGAVLFALGSIATFLAAGSRRPPPREVDADGRDL